MRQGESNWKDALLFSLPPALALVSIDVVRAHRSDYWTPGNAEQWMAALAVFCCYTGVLLAATASTKRLYAVAFARTLPQALEPVAAGLCAATLWAVLAICGGTGAAILVMGSAAALGIGILQGIAVLRGRKLARAFAAMLCLGSAAGASSMVAATSHFILSPRRGSLATLCASGWAVVALLFFATVWGLTKDSRRGAMLRLVSAAVLVALPLGVLRAVAGIRSGASESAPEHPNVVLITFDALRADVCSVYGGSVPTPSLAGLSRRGVRFERAYSLAPWTLPAMNGLFTSEYPVGLSPDGSPEQWREETGCYWLDPATPSFAELLARRGTHVCGAFVGNPLFRGSQGLLRGYEHHAAYFHLDTERRGRLQLLPCLFDALGACFPDRFPLRPVDTSRLVTTRALAFLREYRDAPFFLWIHFMDPHDPFDPPERYRRREGEWLLFCPDNPQWGSPQWQDDYRIAVEAEDRPFVQSLYEGEVEYADECAGRVFDEIGRLGIHEQTYVLATADHGEEFWEHGRFGHGQALYDELIRVPLVVAGPGIAPREIREPVSAIHLAPTMADQLGMEAPEHWRGVSLMPMLRAEASESGTGNCYIQATNSRQDSEPLQAIVSPAEIKLIRGTRTGRVQLHDLQDDPHERTNVVSDDQEATRLLDELEVWTESFPSTFARKHVGDGGAQPSEELLDQLEAVGYLD